MFHLDLSNNQIYGEIPNWIWEVGNGSLLYLNLSHYFLVEIQEPFEIPSLDVLDLHSNQLHGEIPTPLRYIFYVDYLSNRFSSLIPTNFGNFISSVYFISLSDNNLTGIIPESMCNATYLEVLNLSNNSFSGTIPRCLIERNAREWKDTLRVPNLSKNNLRGSIPMTFPENCGLLTLDLSDNHLERVVPESLANCPMLEVLNLGNNLISGTFPCWLMNSTSIRVLVLRSNKFHGSIGCPAIKPAWPMLQIVDLASNNFSGKLLPQFFFNWKTMMPNEEASSSKLNHPSLITCALNSYHSTILLPRSGEIPKEIGDLKSLYVLNLSQNGFTGQFPSTLENLKQLESLDLSLNKPIGEIPPQLASLTFLSVLNLSFNRLERMILRGNQIQTFIEASFQGNKGLCKPPLHASCIAEGLSLPTFEVNKHLNSRLVIDWDIISVEIGFVVGLGIIIGSLVFCKRWRRWYYGHVDHVLWRIFGMQQLGRGNHGNRGYIAQRRRL
ncbi:hypothetical protein ACSBR2_034605 [Camellia fascicularis]